MTDVLVADCAKKAGLHRKKEKMKVKTKKANCKALLFVGYLIFMHLTNLVLASAVNMKVDLSSFGEMRLGGPYVHSGCLPGKVVCFYFLQLN